MGNQIMRRIRESLTHNLGLKVMALLAAALLWLLVVNLDDPTQSRNFTATVTVENEDVLTEQGKFYELPNGNTVTFRVTARRSVIEDLSSSDFSATADMNYLEDDTRIPIVIEATRHANALSISTKTHYLTVAVGDKSQSTYQVRIGTIGEPASGYAVGQLFTTPSAISVDGPAEIVSKINSAMVTVDVSGASADVSEVATPRFYASDGKEVDATGLTLSTDRVEIHVDIVGKKQVKVIVETSGALPEGLELDTIEAEPKEITLIGEPSALNSVSAVTIPADVINLSNITEDLETTVDISSYLPEGVSVQDEDEQQITVRVSLQSRHRREFAIPTANLTIRNLGSGLKGEFDADSVTVVLTGLRRDLEAVNESSLTGSVDVSGLTVGRHGVAVSLDLPEALVADAATVDINIIDERPTEAPAQPSSSQTSSTQSSSSSSQSSASVSESSSRNTGTAGSTGAGNNPSGGGSHTNQ